MTLKIPAPRLLPMTIATLAALLAVKCGVFLEAAFTEGHKPGGGMVATARAAGSEPAAEHGKPAPPPPPELKQADCSVSNIPTAKNPCCRNCGSAARTRCTRRASRTPADLSCRGRAESRGAGRRTPGPAEETRRPRCRPEAESRGRMARPGETVRDHEAARGGNDFQRPVDARAAANSRPHERRQGRLRHGGDEPRQGARRHRRNWRRCGPAGCLAVRRSQDRQPNLRGG